MTAVRPEGQGYGPATYGDYNNLIYDGSFEIAGRRGAVTNVPSIMTPSQQGTFIDFNYLPGAGYDEFYNFGGYLTHWLQSDDPGNRWVITDTKAAHGRYSATVTLDSTKSRWLWPIAADFFNYGVNMWGYSGTSSGGASAYPSGTIFTFWQAYWGWDVPLGNPDNTTKVVHAKVFASQDCVIEFEGWQVDYGWFYSFDNAYASNSNGYYTGGFPPVFHRGEIAVKAGAWVDVSWDIPAAYLSEIVDLVVKTSFRVSGTPGTQVWVDDVFLDPVRPSAVGTAMTVGVAEWIRDEQGLYVGANLWIKNGSPDLSEDPRSSLVAPYVVDPCVNLPVYGANILRDPGFERHLSNVTPPAGHGLVFPSGYSASTQLPGQRLAWHDYAGENEYVGAPPTFDQLVGEEGLSTGWSTYNPDANGYGRWYVSTANPHSGTYHARFDWTGNWDPTFPYVYSEGPPTYLLAIGGYNCADPFPYSARVEPGDVVTASAWFYFTEPGGVTEDMWCTVSLVWSKQAGGPTVPTPRYVSSSQIVTPGSWQKITVSAVVPETAYWAGLEISYDGTFEYYDGFGRDAGDYVLDIDDAVLSVVKAP